MRKERTRRSARKTIFEKKENNAGGEVFDTSGTESLAERAFKRSREKENAGG